MKSRLEEHILILTVQLFLFMQYVFNSIYLLKTSIPLVCFYKYRERVINKNAESLSCKTYLSVTTEAFVL